MTHHTTSPSGPVVQGSGSATFRSLRSLTIVNLRLYIRDPIGAFFTLAFPVMLVVIFGVIYGNAAQAMFDGYGSMDISMPAYTALILGSVGILGVAINTSSHREAGILHRYRATPMRPLVYITADVIANLVMMMAGMVGVVIVGWGLYRVRFEGNAAYVLLAVLLSALAMFAVGHLIAAVAPTARTAQLMGMGALYPMLFLSGATIPLEVMPASVQSIAEFLPLTYVVRLLRGLWFGESWSSLLTETVVLIAILAVATAGAVRLFRWE